MFVVCVCVSALFNVRDLGSVYKLDRVICKLIGESSADILFILSNCFKYTFLGIACQPSDTFSNLR